MIIFSTLGKEQDLDGVTCITKLIEYSHQNLVVLSTISDTTSVQPIQKHKNTLNSRNERSFIETLISQQVLNLCPGLSDRAN